MNILARTEVRFKENGEEIPNTMSGCEYYRQYIPLEHLRYTHQDVKLDYVNELNHPDLDIKKYDLYHFVRKDIIVDKEGNWKNAGNIQLAKENGLPIVMDIDDYWRLDDNHLYRNYYREQKVGDFTKHFLRESDAIVTTNELLAEKVYKVNKNVHVIPNCVHPLFDCFSWSEPDKIDSDKVRIGWVGGVHHLYDMHMIRHFFRMFWESSLSDIATTVLCGYDEEQEAYKGIMNIMKGIIKVNGKDYIMEKGEKNFYAIKHMSAYHYNFMYQHVDIAIIPLADSEFNRCKSELKLIEAGHFGIPVICSDVYPYNTVIEHDINGYLVKPNEIGATWLKYAKELIENPEKRFKMGQNLKNTIRDRFNIAEANKKRYNLFNELIAH